MTIIHVNSNTIKSNRKHSANNPPISIRKTRTAKPEYTHHLQLIDNNGQTVATITYQPDNPLPCGAQIWIETTLTTKTHTTPPESTTP
jgi:hypothetical protein